MYNLSQHTDAKSWAIHILGHIPEKRWTEEQWSLNQISKLKGEIDNFDADVKDSGEYEETKDDHDKILCPLILKPHSKQLGARRKNLVKNNQNDLVFSEWKDSKFPLDGVPVSNCFGLPCRLKARLDLDLVNEMRPSALETIVKADPSFLSVVSRQY